MHMCACVVYFNKVFMFICARVCVCVYVYWLVGSLYIFLSFTSLFFCVSQIERRVFESGKSPSVFAESTEKTKTKKRIFTGFMGTELIALHELRCYDRCLHVFYSGCRCYSIALSLLLDFCITYYFHSVCCCRMWVCECKRLFTFASIVIFQVVTHTHTHVNTLTHRETIYLFSFLI